MQSDDLEQGDLVIWIRPDASQTVAIYCGCQNESVTRNNLYYGTIRDSYDRSTYRHHFLYDGKVGSFTAAEPTLRYYTIISRARDAHG